MSFFDTTPAGRILNRFTRARTPCPPNPFLRLTAARHVCGAWVNAPGLSRAPGAPRAAIVCGRRRGAREAGAQCLQHARAGARAGPRAREAERGCAAAAGHEILRSKLFFEKGGKRKKI